jgi:O-antigen/teichoic acid export membrane protein
VSLHAPQTVVARGATSSGWRRAIAGVPRGLWVFIDQAVVSLANFAAPIAVGRSAGQEELGYFVLGFSIYLFSLGLARAMVWTAYTRRNPQLDPADRPAYAGSATVHLTVFAALSCVLTLLVATGAWTLKLDLYAWLLTIVGPCAAAMLLREHVRRLGLARFDFFDVFVFDTVVSIVQVLLLVWLAVRGTVCANEAFLALAVTSMLAVPWLLLRSDTWRIDWRRVLPDWNENWSITKWLAGGATAVLLGKEGYNWLLSAIASIAELGRLGAARVIVQMTNPLVIGVSNYLGPVSAKVHADDGVAGLWRYTVRTTAVMAASIGVFLLGVAIVGVPVVHLIFGKAAEGVSTFLLVTLSAGLLSEALLIPIEYAMVNLGRTRLMFNTAIMRLVVNATIGFSLVGLFGAEAIGVGMLLGSLVALGWQWAAFAQEARDG